MMNFTSNTIGGILTPIAVGLIVAATGSFFQVLIAFAVAGVLFTAFSLLLDYSRKLPV